MRLWLWLLQRGASFPWRRRRRRWRGRRRVALDLSRGRCGWRRQPVRANHAVHERHDRDRDGDDPGHHELNHVCVTSDEHLLKPPRQIVDPPEHETREHVTRGAQGTLAAPRRVLQRLPEVRVDFAPPRLSHARREAGGVDTRPRPSEARSDEGEQRRLHAGANLSLALRLRRGPLACALRASITTASPAAVIR